MSGWRAGRGLQRLSASSFDGYSASVSRNGSDKRAARSVMNNRGVGGGGGGGGGGTGWKGAKFSTFISKTSRVLHKATTTTNPAAPIQKARTRGRRRGGGGGHGVGRMTTITHIGDDVEDKNQGRFATLIRKVSNAKGVATAQKRARGAGNEGGQVRAARHGEGGKRNSRPGNSVMGPCLTAEEIHCVRDRCKRMIAATATAGTLADARKALLDTALVTHPDLHQADLDKYMAIRGLEASEEVDPQRIRELAVALFLLSRQQSLTFDSMVRVAYHIFDEDGDGELDREEFQQLMKATLSTHLTLDFVLRLPAGKEAFLRHLKEEYAEENFYFWQSSEQFSSSLPTVAKAQTLYDGYIREGAPKQVNISAATNEWIRDKWQAVQLGEAPLTRKLFSTAQTEVFNLMQRDNFERFRQNPTSMEEFVSLIFKEMDRSNNGTISLEEYAEWASNNREVMRSMTVAGERVAFITTLPRGMSGMGSSSSSSGIETLRSIASRGVNKVRGNRVMFVRSDSTSANSSSSSASPSPPPSKSTPRAGEGNDIGAQNRHRHRYSRGSNGGQGDGDAGAGDANLNGRNVAAGHGRLNLVDDINLKTNPTAAVSGGDQNNDGEIAAAWISEASSSRRHFSSSRRKSGRVICSGGQGEDDGLRIEHGGRDGGKGIKDGIGGASIGSVNDRGRSPSHGSDGNVAIAGGISVRRRIRPMLAFYLLWGILVRGTKWAKNIYHPTSAKL